MSDAEALAAVADEIQRHRASLNEAVKKRDALIQEALQAGLSPTTIARAARVSRALVYKTNGGHK